MYKGGAAVTGRDRSLFLSAAQQLHVSGLSSIMHTLVRAACYIRLKRGALLWRGSKHPLSKRAKSYLGILFNLIQLTGLFNKRAFSMTTRRVSFGVSEQQSRIFLAKVASSNLIDR